MPVNKLVERARSRPPRCLAGFGIRADGEVASRVQSELGHNSPDMAVFEILPPALGDSPALLGHYLDKDWPHRPGRILVSPLAIRWTLSGAVVPLFDGTQHGYNPEYGLGRVHTLSANPMIEWVPPTGACEQPVYAACFFYNPADQENMESDVEMASHPEDFFETFLLAVYCRVRDAVEFVTEFECA